MYLELEPSSTDPRFKINFVSVGQNKFNIRTTCGSGVKGRVLSRVEENGQNVLRLIEEPCNSASCQFELVDPIEMLFKEIDTNGDGVISFKEGKSFKKHYNDISFFFYVNDIDSNSELTFLGTSYVTIATTTTDTTTIPTTTFATTATTPLPFHIFQNFVLLAMAQTNMM